MVQGYYTLEQAAQVLGMKPEELKAMAQRNQIRSFQDRGTWRFRIPDIQELARQRGVGSDTDFIMSHSPKPRSSDSPAPKSPSKGQPEIYKFADSPAEDSVDVGTELVLPGGSKKGDSKKGGSKKPITPTKTPKPAGSDSDVRLVRDDSDDMDFVVGGPGEVKLVPGSDSDVKLVRDDSDVKMVHEPGPASTPKVVRPSAMPPKSGPAKKKDGPISDSAKPPVDSDSDVKIVGTSSLDIDLGALPQKAASDSDIRLEGGRGHAEGTNPMALTEEINLDEEIKKHEAAQKPKSEAKMKRKDSPRLDETSPFELSDSGMNAPGVGLGRKSDLAKKPTPDSSDVELTPAPDSSDFELTVQGSSPLEGESEDFSLQLPDDESDATVDLGGPLGNELKGPSSGISLGNPKDAGISLEKPADSSEDMDFELSLDVQATPKPAAAKKGDSDSEFELSLDLDDSSGNAPAAKPPMADSEFELTLDDSTDLSASDSKNPQVKAGDKDIFETDFEVPALEDESGSQVAALETDLDSSDFDLALDSSDLVSADDESGSQVVALDEEEAVDDAAATVAAKRKPGAKKDAEEIAEFGDLEVAEDEISVEEEAEVSGEVRERVVVQEKLVPAAPWGALPVVFMLPCVAVMVLVGVMGFELVQSMAGYKPAGFLTRTVGELVGQKIK